MIRRNVCFDYLRVFACLSVIMIHVFAAAKTDFPLHTIIENNASICIINCLHWSVPIFFMITGALFLKRKSEIDIKIYLKKYVLKYVIVIFTFGWIFAIIEQIFNHNFSLIMPFTALVNTFCGHTWNHMWYLYDLVGVMLCIPILNIIKEKNEKWLKYIFILLIISSVMFPFINNLFDINIGFEFPINSVYLAYAIAGYFISTKEYDFSKITICFGILICFCLLIFSQIMFEKYNLYFLSTLGGYDSIIIFVLSSLIFILFNKFNFKENKIILDISKNSFGIYLVHMFWINVIYKFAKFNIYGKHIVFNSILVFMMTIILSLFSTKILKKIPLFNKIV